MAEENMALATLGNPRLDTESYIYIYGPDRWITSPNVTVLSTKVTEIMTTPTDSGVHRRYILSTDYCVIPSNAKVELCEWFNEPDFTGERRRYDASPSYDNEEVWERIINSVENINQKPDDMSTKMGSAFDGIGERLDRICEGLDGIIAGLDRGLDRLNDKFGQSDYRVDLMGCRLDGMCGKHDEVSMLAEERVMRQKQLKMIER